MYIDEHWQILINTIIERIGVEEFLRRSAEALKEKYPDLASEFNSILMFYKPIKA